MNRGVKLLLLNVRNKKKCIYSDAVNDQGAVLKRLHSEGAEQCFSISKPAEGRAGVSINWAVEHSGGTVDDSLRHVGFTLQHRGLWGYSTYLRDQDMCWKLLETDQSLTWSSPLMRTNDSARMEPTLFSAVHT